MNDLPKAGRGVIMSNAAHSRARHIRWQPRLLALAAAAAAPALLLRKPGVHHGGGGGLASGFEQELKNAPASISVVTRQELETKNFRDLAEALQGVEGIDVMGGTGKTGGLDISIRGMPSDYTLI
jgi:outer membrane receptor for ferrienterochelin and colicins